MKGVIILGDANASGRGAPIGWNTRLKNFVEQDFYDTVYDLSLPGETSYSLSQNIEEVNRRIWHRKKEDAYLALIFVGRDDCKSVIQPKNTQVNKEDFKKNMKQIITYLQQKVQSIAVFQIPYVNESQTNPHKPSNTYHDNNIIKEYNTILEGLNCEYVSLTNTMKEAKEIIHKGIFLNKKGHDLCYEKARKIHNEFLENSAH